MRADNPNKLKATLIGTTAVLLWGTLALFTTLTGKIPAFQLSAMAFGIATVFVLLKWTVRREPVIRHLRQPIGAWALGTLGLFGYHFFYFMALKNAPPVESWADRLHVAPADCRRLGTVAGRTLALVACGGCRGRVGRGRVADHRRSRPCRFQDRVRARLFDGGLLCADVVGVIRCSIVVSSRCRPIPSAASVP